MTNLLPSPQDSKEHLFRYRKERQF